MNRVRQGEDGLTVAADLGLWEGGLYADMLCHPEEWGGKYKEAQANNEFIRMSKGIEPEAYYECLAEGLIEEFTGTT